MTLEIENVSIVEDKSAVIAELAKIIEESANSSIEKSGTFNIGVSGGSLAAFLKEGLCKIQTDITKWRIFFCDERVVPEESEDSTFGLYKKNLIGTIHNLREDQFIKIKWELNAQAAAEDYVQQMAHHFPPDTALPRFDALLLGMGPDGHTCSLFPGHELLTETRKWVAAITDSPKPPAQRVTLTLPVINNAALCVFAACGAEKQGILKKIFVDKEDLPAAQVKPKHGRLVWILDESAAGGLH